MSLNNSQYNAIMRIYNQRQFQDKYEQDQRREEVYQKVPQIRQIEDEISSQAVRCARKLLDGDTNAKEELKQHIEDLREQKEVLLSAFGFPADYMEMHYACPECQDTGYVDGRKCRCFKKEEIRLLYSQSNIEEVLLRENFDSFSYEYYDDRVVIPEIQMTVADYMRQVHTWCKEYVENFDAGERDMTKYIIGAISEMDTPLTPSAEGNRSMSAWITHMTEEDYQSVRNQVLDAQPEDIRALAGGIRELLKEGSFCVIGNESRLEKDKELFDQVKNL
mgnify:CR=1 FL=1